MKTVRKMTTVWHYKPRNSLSPLYQSSNMFRYIRVQADGYMWRDHPNLRWCHLGHRSPRHKGPYPNNKYVKITTNFKYKTIEIFLWIMNDTFIQLEQQYRKSNYQLHNLGFDSENKRIIVFVIVKSAMSKSKC